MKKLAKNMEEMFHKKSEAVRVSPGSVLCAWSHTETSGADTNEPSSQRKKLIVM